LGDLALINQLTFGGGVELAIRVLEGVGPRCSADTSEYLWTHGRNGMAGIR